jgi:L-histidine N-alpha-methyltransferase
MPVSASSRTEGPGTGFPVDVRHGLARAGQKQLPPEYFYDDIGSALFEAITRLPEYGLTRADRLLLENHAPAIAGLLPGRTSVIELGSGTGSKTAHLLRAIGRRQRCVTYYPVDVSHAALAACERELGALATVVPIEATFVDGVRRALSGMNGRHHVLVLFLGSTIGNYDRDAAADLLSNVRALLEPGDSLLIGADLVKPPARLLAAYDDPAGVTAAFNLNLLGRINRELGANFDLRNFRHQARYVPIEKRIEMHLVSAVRQTVLIPGAGCSVSFEPGETIWTESSHKYDLPDLTQMAARSGYRMVRVWTDEEWPFAECLWQAI